MCITIVKDYIVIQYDEEHGSITSAKSYPKTTVLDIVKELVYSPLTYFIFVDGYVRNPIPKQENKITNRIYVEDEDFNYSSYDTEEFRLNDIDSQLLHDGTRKFFMATKYDRLNIALDKLTHKEIEALRKYALFNDKLE